MASPSETPISYPPGYLEEYRQSYNVGFVAPAFIILETVAIILRILSRKLQKNGLSWGDGFMAFSWIFNIVLCVMCLYSLRFGVGRHIQTVQPWQLEPYFQLIFYAGTTMYLFAVTLPKLAVLDLYLHIFVGRTTRMISWATGVALVLNVIINAIFIADQCHPVSQLWDPVPGGSCNNILLHFELSGIPNLVTDVVMLLLPLPTIWYLHTSRNTKIGIFLTLLVGNLGLATSILRFIGFTQSFADATWAASEALSTAIIEAGVYHVCACLMTYRPLFVWLANDSFAASSIQRYLRSRSKEGSGLRQSTMGDATRKFQQRWLSPRRRDKEDSVLSSVLHIQALQLHDSPQVFDQKGVGNTIHVQYEFEVAHVVTDRRGDGSGHLV